VISNAVGAFACAAFVGCAATDAPKARDATVRRSSLRSLRISNRGSEPFGAIMQTLRDPTLRGRTVRFSAWLRTDSASGNGFGGGGALNVQAMRNGSRGIARLACCLHRLAPPVEEIA
jgi:hypothetical protein